MERIRWIWKEKRNDPKEDNESLEKVPILLREELFLKLDITLKHLAKERLVEERRNEAKW